MDEAIFDLARQKLALEIQLVNLKADTQPLIDQRMTQRRRLDSEIDQLLAPQIALEDQIDALEAEMLRQMADATDADHNGVSIRVHKPKKASVKIEPYYQEHPEELPEGCHSVEFVPRKNEIYKRLMAGEKIPGCSLEPGTRTVVVEVMNGND